MGMPAKTWFLWTVALHTSTFSLNERPENKMNRPLFFIPHHSSITRVILKFYISMRSITLYEKCNQSEHLGKEATFLTTERITQKHTSFCQNYNIQAKSINLKQQLLLIQNRTFTSWDVQTVPWAFAMRFSTSATDRNTFGSCAGFPVFAFWLHVKYHSLSYPTHYSFWVHALSQAQLLCYRYAVNLFNSLNNSVR